MPTLALPCPPWELLNKPKNEKTKQKTQQNKNKKLNNEVELWLLTSLSEEWANLRKSSLMVIF